MKTEMTDEGWREITTKNIVVTRLGTKPLMPVVKWIDFNKRHPGIGRKRRVCNCCHESWEGMFGNVNIVFTNKGNKSVCDDCLRGLSNRIIHGKTLGG